MQSATLDKDGQGALETYWPEMEEFLLAGFLEKRAKNTIIKRWWFRERARALFAQCYPEYSAFPVDDSLLS